MPKLSWLLKQLYVKNETPTIEFKITLTKVNVVIKYFD